MTAIFIERLLHRRAGILPSTKALVSLASSSNRVRFATNDAFRNDDQVLGTVDRTEQDEARPATAHAESSRCVMINLLGHLLELNSQPLGGLPFRHKHPKRFPRFLQRFTPYIPRRPQARYAIQRSNSRRERSGQSVHYSDPQYARCEWIRQPRELATRLPSPFVPSPSTGRRCARFDGTATVVSDCAE